MVNFSVKHKSRFLKGIKVRVFFEKIFEKKALVPSW